MIPSNLKDFLPHPQTPWKISPDVSQRLEPKTNRFKAAILHPSDPESALIVRYFIKNKPPGYSIGQITCIHNRSLHAGFTAHLTHTEEEAKKFPPSWETEALPQERKSAIESWRAITQPFSPITVTIEQETEVLESAKVLPLWHGTTFEKAQSICESGFTYFGKHAYFTGRGSGSTDIGYFGSGIYFTDSAQYATMYSQRFLLLSWVSMREPYPVLNDKPFPQNGNDMIILKGKGAYKNYDTHFVPVASIMPHEPYCMNYFPCYQNQTPAWHEIVVFQKAQALPCFIIELSEDLIHPPSTTYSFAHGFAACKAGEFSQIEAWINEDRKRLQEENELGENLLFAAVLGNQLPLFKWLYAQEPSSLQKCRKDGWTLMHVAVASGYTSIVKWLHLLDPLMIKSGKATSLHIAAFNEQTEVLQLFLEEVKQDVSLIEEILKSPCPRTLKFLLENGLDPHQTNRFKQTLLHLAAQHGQVEHIELLLEKGVQLNAQDLSKKTPLYLAVTRGHLAATVCLLEEGADPTITGIEGDTIVHAAAFYGYTPLLQMLLNNPQIKQLIGSRDEDGKHPLHKAVWGHAKPDTVKLLLENGADSNALNKFGYTPLHWAAKHGHIESADMLIKAGASLEIANQNHDLPFDLAIRWGQDDFVHFFLGTEHKLNAAELPKDTESHYYRQILQAKRENLIQEQIVYLEKLSDHYLQKKNWAKAAKLLNSALAILEKNLKHPPFQTYLLARLERIEALFLESQGIKVSAQHRGVLLNHRTWLKNIRALYIQQYNEKVSIQEIIPFLTNSYRKLLGTLILDSQELLGKPPTLWACLGMGSMARNEMCPYSDLEFAFLLNKKTDKALKYFRTLAQLIEIRIINMGETKFPIFAQLFGEASIEASPTPGGFCMDSGGNTPLGKPDFYELIDTPQGLAQYQSIEWMEADIIVTNALSAVCHIVGDQRLFHAYNEAKEKALNTKDGTFSFTGVAFRKKLAMKLLQGNLHEFKPNLSKSKQETNAFGIKKELYRPLQSLLGSLTLFYGLPLCSSFGMIKQLRQKGIFCPEGAKNLIQALSQVLSLRFEAHTFYQNEGEFLLHIEEDKPQDPQDLYLDEKRLGSLHEIYKVLIPFHACAEQFLRTKDAKSFRTSPFYDTSPQIQGVAFKKNLQYGKAQEACQQAVSLNPNDINAQAHLGDIEQEMAQYEEALKRHFKALALAQQKHGENHPDVAASYDHIGGVYKHLGDLTQALEFHHKALKIRLQVLGVNHPSVATSYNNIGIVYRNRKEYNRALEFHRKALKIQLHALGKNHPEVALSHNNMGAVYYNLGELTPALECYQKALKIQLQVLGENHPDVATIYNNIGLVYDSLKEYVRALEFHHKALKIRLQVLGANHPYVATSYSNIGIVYRNRKEYNRALEFHRQALKIDLQVLGENHPHVAGSYNNIGNVYERREKYDRALEFYQKALKILLQSCDKNHLGVPVVLKSLITCAEQASSYQFENLQEASVLCREVLGEQDPLVQQLIQLMTQKLWTSTF